VGLEPDEGTSGKKKKKNGRTNGALKRRLNREIFKGLPGGYKKRRGKTIGETTAGQKRRP